MPRFLDVTIKSSTCFKSENSHEAKSLYELVSSNQFTSTNQLYLTICNKPPIYVFYTVTYTYLGRCKISLSSVHLLKRKDCKVMFKNMTVLSEESEL